jgi:hypothetical protein
LALPLPLPLPPDTVFGKVDEGDSSIGVMSGGELGEDAFDPRCWDLLEP